MIKVKWNYLLCLFVAFGCKEKSCETIDSSAIEVNIELERLEDELFLLESKTEVAEFLERNKILKEHFLVSATIISKGLEQQTSAQGPAGEPLEIRFPR